MFWCEGEWKAAGTLKAGDLLTLADGSQVEVTDITYEDRHTTVYNMEVADYHTYYVGEDGVWVHNTDGCITSGGGLSKESGEEGTRSTRRQAFRDAKEAAGIPKSMQFSEHRFVYDGSTENRIVYEFDVNGELKYIIEHPFDTNGRGNHFHWADDLYGSPFEKGTYHQQSGHFPEDPLGFQ